MTEMSQARKTDDGLHRAAIVIQARQLLATVCILGGNDCPLLSKSEARAILDRVKGDPTVTMRLDSDADVIPHYKSFDSTDPTKTDRQAMFNRKRDLDVLQRLGLCPGDTRRARYLYTLLFERIATPFGICAYETPGWEGCPLARSGAYERVREQGWQAVVYLRPQPEKDEYRRRNVEAIMNGERLFIRPHHLLCIACGHAGGELRTPRPEDTIYEIIQRIQAEPDVPITLVEGTCDVCDCCDGYSPPNHRCVHPGGLIRDYKRDLDVLQKLGLMPGDTMKARALFKRLFERVPSTKDVCGYGDGVSRSHAWSVCGEPQGAAGYARTRETGWF